MHYILPASVISNELREKVIEIYTLFAENPTIKQLQEYSDVEIAHLQIANLAYQLKEGTLAAMGRSVFDELVTAAFVDVMSMHSLIDCDPSYKQDGYLVQAFVEYFPWYRANWDMDENDDSFSGVFFRQVIDPLYSQCADIMVNAAKLETSWRVWGISRVGRDVCVEIGEDYRILEWTRQRDEMKLRRRF